MIKYGLTDYFTSQLKNKLDINNLARVTLVSKNGCRAITNVGFVLANVKSSHLHYHSNFLIPKIGDFVVLVNKEDSLTPEKQYLINYIIPPFSQLKRKVAGKRTNEQVIANNIDYAFIVIALDEQFNLNKANRIIMACLDGNIKPVIVLNKTDIEGSAEKIKLANEFFSDNNFLVLATSIYTSNYQQIAKLLQDNKTGVLVGSSGSGKSTLINMLMDKEVQKTAAVSEVKQQGVHTTSSREIFLLKNGGLVIDTPGMREFAVLLDDKNSLLQSFADINTLSEQCKFYGCSHTNEEGCNVLKQLELGKINQERYQEYIKLSAQVLETENEAYTHKKKHKAYYKKINKIIENTKYSKQFKKDTPI